MLFRIAVLTLLVVSSAMAEEGWKEESDAKGVVIQSRLRPGSSLKEFRAVGAIEATPAKVFAVIDDAESYAGFMPYVAEARVLRREKNSAVLYQRLSLPLVSDRDYTIVSKHETSLGPDGPIYRVHWEAANNLGPLVKSGVVRVNLCEGGWLLEPNGPNTTRATYLIYTDSGGAIPAFIANNGSRVAIRKLFEAVRKQVKDPKYAGARKDG
ncbi:MAG: START domain-containing protein [Verrucomicrobiota bacterium]|nr:START domain-containing protein [Verrucomicrobiota bacterium]